MAPQLLDIHRDNVVILVDTLCYTVIEELFIADKIFSPFEILSLDILLTLRKLVLETPILLRWQTLNALLENIE